MNRRLLLSLALVLSIGNPRELLAAPTTTAAKKADKPDTTKKKQDDDERNNEACLECHGDADNVAKKYVVSAKLFARGPHTEDNGVSCVGCHAKAAKVEDISEHGKLGKATCEGCHDAKVAIRRSVHGTPRKGAKLKPPTCANCHGAAHRIVRGKNLASPMHPRNQLATCGKCHKGEPLDKFIKSIHGKRMMMGKRDGPSCASCHSGHAVMIADIEHNAPFKVRMVKVCSSCHAVQAERYIPSAHGQALMTRRVYSAPSCVDCHRSHDIDKARDLGSTVHKSRTVDLCAECHANEKLIRKEHLKSRVVSTYRDSFHGRAGKLGSGATARCTSCHAYHGVYGQADERSTVHKKKLRETCGKCHTGASDKFIDSKIHVKVGGEENYWAHLVRSFYLVLIFIVLGGMVVHNLLDFIRKAIIRARKQADEPHVVRMTLLERILHGALAMSFLSLCYTGFALIYPDQWWVAPMNWISDTERFRSISHRMAGLVLTGLTLHHLWFIFFHRLGREQFKRLLPRWRDFRDFGHNILWLLGKREQRPYFGRFSYMEKAEYWALVWGTVLMIVTGFMLWFERSALDFIPLWLWEVGQVVHRFEAILALGAIVVWHFYYVMANPDEAPLSLTFLTGKMSMHELAIVHPEEYDEVVAEQRKQGRAEKMAHKAGQLPTADDDTSHNVD